MTVMVESEQATVVRQVIEAFNQGDMDGVVAGYADDAEHWEPVGTYRGRDEILASFKTWNSAFPDARADVSNIIASGDDVAVELTYRGTHTGALPMPQGEIPATNKSAEVPSVMIATVRDGKVQNARVYYDMATLMGQLGLA